MWQLTENRYGVILPVSRLTIDDPAQTTVIANVTLRALTAAAQLTLPADLTAAFVSESTRYAFPLSGADFVSAKTGSLEVTCSPDETGRRAVWLCSEQTGASIDGGGAFAQMNAAGYVTRSVTRLPILLWIAARRRSTITTTTGASDLMTPVLSAFWRN